MKENIFYLIIYSTHQKKGFYKKLGNFWKIEFFPKFDRRDPYKNSENFAQSLILLRKYFLTKSSVPSSQEVFLLYFRLFLENWIFDRNSSGADLTKMVKFLYYLKLWKENIFWLNYLFHSSKERFLQKIRQLLENWIFCWNSTGADLTKIVKILYYLKLWKEHIFAILIISLIKRKVSTKN